MTYTATNTETLLQFQDEILNKVNETVYSVKETLKRSNKLLSIINEILKRNNTITVFKTYKCNDFMKNQINY